MQPQIVEVKGHSHLPHRRGAALVPHLGAVAFVLHRSRQLTLKQQVGVLPYLQGSDAAFSALEDLSAMLQQLQGMHKVAAALQQPVAATVALLEGLLGQGPLQGNRLPKSVPSTAAALVEGLKPLLGQLQVGIL